MAERVTQVRIWTYGEAQRSIVYVRRLLIDLRQHYILCWHFFRLSRSGPDGLGCDFEMRLHRQEGAAAVDELKRLGVVAYESPVRGIALFPFHVRGGDGRTSRRREAYYVYKDSRDGIDSFVFDDDLSSENDLFGCEKPVPEAWKSGQVVPAIAEP